LHHIMLDSKRYRKSTGLLPYTRPRRTSRPEHSRRDSVVGSASILSQFKSSHWHDLPALRRRLRSALAQRDRNFQMVDPSMHAAVCAALRLLRLLSAALAPPVARAARHPPRFTRRDGRSYSPSNFDATSAARAVSAASASGPMATDT
jgi:hypothetical protein